MSKNNLIKSILISQPQPNDENSPYFRLVNKWDVKLEFRKFIKIQGISINEFRKLGIEPLDYSAVIFTSKVAIDNFFRILKELRLEMPADTKYFCVSEASSKYLQKYITIRKRKLFVGIRRAMDLTTYIRKHKSDNYLFPCSNLHRKELPNWMREKGIEVTEAPLYRTVSSDLSDIDINKHDMICFFSPSGLKSLFENYPDFEQNHTKVAVFGPTTRKEAENLGLRVDIQAPMPNMPSMTAAIDSFMKEYDAKAK